MDPDKALAELREALQELANDPDAWEDVIEKFEALDGWLSKGGFLPKAWREAKGKQ